MILLIVLFLLLLLLILLIYMILSQLLHMLIITSRGETLQEEHQGPMDPLLLIVMTVVVLKVMGKPTSITDITILLKLVVKTSTLTMVAIIAC
jgi:hypothetical protein